MSRLTYLILIVLTFSCSQKNSKPTIIKGTVANSSVDSVVLSIGDKKLSTPVTSGSFFIESDIQEPKYARLKAINEIPLYISPSSELTIELSPDTIMFSGKTKEVNIYLQSRDENYHKIMSGLKDEEVFNFSEKQFAHKIDSFGNELIMPLEQKSLLQDFVHKEKERIKYWKFDMLSTYHRYSPTFTQKVTLPDEHYFDFIKTVDFNKSDLFEFDEYKEFLFSYVLGITYIQSVEEELSDEDRTNLMFSMAEEHFKVQEIKDYVVIRVMKRLLYSLQLNENIIKRYKQRYADSEEFKDILENFEKTKCLLKGNIAPDFLVVDVDGKEVHLSDYIGTAVYIDIWSPFCAPCIHEFGYCHKLQEEFKNKKIEFLSICLDDSETRWQNNIEKYQLKGVLLRAKDGRKSEIVNQYTILGVPRFMFIDKEGKIVSANAPYPSDLSLKNMINTYL